MVYPVDFVSFDLSVSLKVCGYFGLLIFFMNFLWSKVYLILYLVKAKMLRNAFAYWNGRVYAAVLRSGFTKSKRGRTTFPLLFKVQYIEA